MYRFDYSSMEELTSLCNRLNESGKKLAGEGLPCFITIIMLNSGKVQGYEQFLTGRGARKRRE